MAEFNHISKDKMDHIIDRIGEVRSALDGLAALFYYQGRDYSPSPNEVYGMGDLIKGQARALAALDDILRYGHDNQSVTDDYQKSKHID